MFFDEILENPSFDFDKETIDRLLQTEVIFADNVAKFFYEGTDKEYWDLKKDFPCLTPPFKLMFIEWNRPEFIRSELFGNITPQTNIKKFGVLIQSWLTRDHYQLSGFPAPAYTKEDLLMSKWGMIAVLFLKLHTNEIIRPIFFSILINADGQLFDLSNGKISFVIGLTNGSENIVGLTNEMVQHSQTFLNVPFLAISLMHCKNASLSKIVPSSKLQNSRIKKNKLPLMKYKILDILPIKKILTEEGDLQRTGIKMALHICRGHFKDYRQSGLFGKYKGLYWWEAHARGKISQGIITKDYNIKESRVEPGGEALA